MSALPATTLGGALVAWLPHQAIAPAWIHTKAQVLRPAAAPVPRPDPVP
ncbi:hypothetical protein RCH09_001479 [Actimicrobium sp. GrIS 1.19]|nr:hypothetical protein [Actimicrobium sp. GrIS 1.19]